MKPSRIYIVEDMAMSRTALVSMLTKNDFNVVGSAANADVKWDEIQGLEIDLILLDINLAGKKDGIWLASMIRENLKMAIVFLTAFGDKETLDKLTARNPNGYLLKPYNKPTLLTTINIAVQSYKALFYNKPDIENQTITIETGGKKIKLQLETIVYVQSEGNYIEIHLKNSCYIVRHKLASFLESLPENDFIVQCHSRFLINKKKINIITPGHIVIDGKDIPISKKYKTAIDDL